MRMFHSSDLLLMDFLLLMFASAAGKILPPQNLTLVWETDFQPWFSWDPPPRSDTSCKYKVDITGYKDMLRSNTTFGMFLVMEGGSLSFSVKTVCGNNESEPATLNVTSPDLVTALDCYSYTATLVNCTWSAAGDSSNLTFSYILAKEFGDEPPAELQECSSYMSSGGVRTGCTLQASLSHAIHIVLHSTINSTLIRNTFTKRTIYNVRPPPLVWNVTESKHTLAISWSPPDMLDLSEWDFVINYTFCDEYQSIKYKDVLSALINRVPECRYCISINAESNKGQTPARETCVEANEDSLLVYAATTVPLLFAFLTVVAFVCCWKNQDKIFPKVLSPHDLLSDICENKDESSLCKLYVPAEEEANCTITLVADTRTNRTNC
ncbi:interleukin-13 receptor subunit alpha-1 isoform X2 [Nothobranchius furzeri]|uniref:Interleukin 13 receptor, alpha 1 n=1 Tax=Nothobranchius furzeri TaxID=105023 RepID=A0A1A8AKT7_NOTFU|nr:interleukin-13 receptor subunit alpha-1 isoform X2 [Nothobranchius furzeri]